MRQDERQVSINISAIPVAGIGGLGLVAMAGVVSVFFPAIGWMMAAGIAGGVALAAAIVIARRRIKTRGPSGEDPVILFRGGAPEAAAGDRDSRDRPVARSLAPAPYSTR
ncbi:MAG TPA: hypothetical protein VFK57_21475 [Vicinamibacterales bacterium]|nr:hypothetical protein [Vicinamibacterales bacterium]